MDFLCSGAFVRAVSTGAAALYQHLGPAHHHLLRPVFGLCWNALGLGNQLLARRCHSYPREIRNARCWSLARSHGSPITFEVWTGQGTWFWCVANPQRNCGAIGESNLNPKAFVALTESTPFAGGRVYDLETSTGRVSGDRCKRSECLRLKSKSGGRAARICYRT